MANGWTPERKARQAELIRTWRPWDKSTGPRSPEGKAKVSSNAYAGAHWKTMRELVKETNAMLREQRQALEPFLN